MNSPKDSLVEYEVRHEITHDFVLDVYEKSLEVEDPEAKEAIIKTAKMLSESIGDYIVENTETES